MQRHHRSRHRWIWLLVLTGSVIALATALRVRPDYTPGPSLKVEQGRVPSGSGD